MIRHVVNHVYVFTPMFFVYSLVCNEDSALSYSWGGGVPNIRVFLSYFFSLDCTIIVRTNMLRCFYFFVKFFLCVT